MEKDLTRKVVKVIKDVDKLVQDVEKGVGRIIAGAKGVKELFGKDGEKKE